MSRSIIAVCAVLLLAAVTRGLPTHAQAEGDLTLGAEGMTFKNGDRYWIPMNSDTNSLQLFTESVQNVTLNNTSSAEITLNKIEIKIGEGVMSEEFTLLKSQMKRAPLEFAETKLAAGKGKYDFKIRFFPVASNERNAELVVTYNGDKTFTLKLAGRGRENARFFSHGATRLHKLFGAVKTDEMLSTAVGDAEGNIYFSGQATQIVDRFSTDIFYGRINADGTLAWARIWNGPFKDHSPDSGQNAETGGTANSLALDDAGNLYICGATSPDKYNSIFSSLVMKIDGKTGQPLWEKLWRPEWAKAPVGKHHSEAYGLTVRNGRVFVTGFCHGEITLLAFDAADGATHFQRSIDITSGKTDRGYAIAAGADGSVVIGGLADDRACLLKFSGCDGKEPKLLWARRVDLDRAGNINCLDLDAAGNIYASLDRRGATTYCSAAKFTPDGAVAWARTYVGTNGDRNNTHLVRVMGDTLLVGGRLVAGPVYDTNGGDGLLLGLNTADGAEKWSAYYYTGTGPDENGEHRVKGAFVHGKTLTIVGQSYTGSRNGVRYWGYWYDGMSKLEEYKLIADPLMLAEDCVRDLPMASTMEGRDARQLLDLKDRVDWVDANTRTGTPSDGDVAVWQIELK